MMMTEQRNGPQQYICFFSQTDGRGHSTCMAPVSDGPPDVYQTNEPSELSRCIITPWQQCVRQQRHEWMSKLLLSCSYYYTT